MSSIRPLVSVITVVFNGEKYLEETIQSVINQTYYNLEYIIIDGGSTDGTIDIIKKYEDKIAYWVSEKDNGISDAFNKGVAAAKGDWVLFINSGDRLMSNDVIGNMVSYLDPSQDIVFGKVAVVNNDRSILRYSGSEFKRRLFYCYMTIPHQACFHNIKYFQKYGNYRLDFKVAMDYELLLRKKGLKVHFVNEVVGQMLSGGVSQSNDLAVLLEYMRAKRVQGGLFFNMLGYICFGIGISKLCIKKMLLIVGVLKV